MSFSVVIPLYNKEKTIGRALGSVLAQTRTADEVIVVNDGSTDGSGEIAERYAAQGVRVIHQDNKGVSAARNRGINEAKSTHVAFLDADDHWLPIHIETLSLLARRCPDAQLIATRYTSDFDDALATESNADIHLRRCRSAGFLETFAEDHKAAHSSTVAVRRDCLNHIGGFPEGVNRGEDIITWLRLGDLGNSCFSDITTVIRDRSLEESTSASPLKKLPESFEYISSQVRHSKTNRHRLKLLKKLYRNMAISTAAVGRLNGNSGDVDLLLRHSLVERLPVSAAGLLLVKTVPLWILNRIRTSSS